MARLYRRFGVALAAALLLGAVLASSAQQAFASITDVPAPLGSSSTNPSLQTNVDVWWRAGQVSVDSTTFAVGWGMSTYPHFELNLPSVNPEAEGFIIGQRYFVTGTPAIVDPSTPGDYLNATNVKGTNLTNTLSLGAALLTEAPSVPAGTVQHTPYEGVWWYNYRFYTGYGLWGTNISAPFGVDQTPPRAVSGLLASTTTRTADATQTFATSRVNLMWCNLPYDDMSGVGYFAVALDGVPIIPDSSSAPSQGRVFPPASDTTSCSVTIEDLPAGSHTLAVNTIDRATNESAGRSVTIFVDPDVPTISITSPSANVIGVAPTIKVNAQDAGGVKKVDYQLDGYALGTATSSPFSLTADLSGFVNGVHTLTATVTDMYGRTATTSKTVTLDKTPLVLSSLKTGGSGRKPSASIYVNRAATVKIYIPRFKATKTVTTSKAGRVSFSYTYPKGKKYPSVTSFRDSFTITASDSLGNVTSVKGRWTVRISKVVKIGSNKVRIYYY